MPSAANHSKRRDKYVISRIIKFPCIQYNKLLQLCIVTLNNNLHRYSHRCTYTPCNSTTLSENNANWMSEVEPSLWHVCSCSAELKVVVCCLRSKSLIFITLMQHIIKIKTVASLKVVHCHRQSVCLSVHCLSDHLSVYLFVSLSLHPSACLLKLTPWEKYVSMISYASLYISPFSWCCNCSIRSSAGQVQKYSNMTKQIKHIPNQKHTSCLFNHSCKSLNIWSCHLTIN